MVSSWAKIIKEVPQGSILGPLIFHIFINDIFYFITHSKIYNYADGNSLVLAQGSQHPEKKTLEKDGLTLIDWFDSNQTQANPDKFQVVAVGVKSFEQVKYLTLAGVDIPCEEV